MEGIAIVILALALMACGHFIVDGILSPSKQMINRIKLFIQIEEINATKTEKDDRAAKELLLTTVHNLINNMPRYSLWTIASHIYRLDHDPEFKQECRERVEMVDRVKNPGIKTARESVNDIADSVLFWNSYGWAILVIPVALVAVCMKSIEGKVKSLITVPENQTRQDYAVSRI